METLLKLGGKLVPTQLRESLKKALAFKLGAPSMGASLTNMRRLGFNPATIVDVGAFEGEWTREMLEIFPQARFLMLEAQPNKEPKLQALKTAHPGRVDYRMGVMGPEEKAQVTFNQYESAPTASSMLGDQLGSKANRVVSQMTTLDRVLGEAGMLPAGLIKLDVQGFELEVLRGGTGVLAQTQAVLMEVSLIEFYKGNPLLADVTRFMQERGFRVYDICSLLRRPLDQALSQVDLIFVPEHSPLVQSKIWGE